MLELVIPLIGFLFISVYVLNCRQGRRTPLWMLIYWILIGYSRHRIKELCRIVMRVFSGRCANKMITLKLWIHHRGTIFFFFLRIWTFSINPVVVFPAVMWACWSPSATTWNGYRRRKMAKRGRVEETQHGGGKNDRLTNSPWFNL